MSNDVKNKVMLVTGSTDGIGKQTAIDLAELGAHVIVHGRNTKKSENAQKDVIQKSGNKNIDNIAADFSSFSEVKDMIKELHNKYDHLDVLINNAGVVKKKKELSEDGNELTMQVNYFVPFLLTLELVDLLKNAQEKPARIVNVASMVQASHINYDNINFKNTFGGYNAYGVSKVALVMFTYELAEKLDKDQIIVNCLHPGVISTKLLHVNFSGGRPVTEGSKTSVFLAADPSISNITGKYFVDKQIRKPEKIALDPKEREKLWNLSKKITDADPIEMLKVYKNEKT